MMPIAAGVFDTMDPKKPGAPERKWRFSAHLEGRLHYRGVDYECRSENLSRTGVLLRGGLPWPSDETVGFSLDPPGGGLPVELRGRIARIAEDESGEGTTIALEFADLEPAMLSDLEGLVSRVIGAAGEDDAPTLDSLKPGASPIAVRKVLESIPLSDRIALAVRASPKERDILRQDTHPQVLEALARNPNILPAEAHHLVASRSIGNGALEILLRDNRWVRDEQLRAKIVAHPKLPVAIAEQTLGSLSQGAMRQMLKGSSLHPNLRRKIIARLTGAGG